MTNYDLEEEKLLIYQIGLSVLSLLTLAISITLSYNAYLKMKKGKPLYDEDMEKTILISNRTVDFLIVFAFLLINIYDHEIRKTVNKDSYIGDLQIWASIFSVIAAMIVLYVSFSGNFGIVSQENPEI